MLSSERAKSTIFFAHAQVQYVWMPRWCISTVKPHSLVTLRITKGVSEVVYVRIVNSARQIFAAAASCFAPGCWGTHFPRILTLVQAEIPEWCSATI